MANSITWHETNLRIGDTVRVHYKLIEKEEVAGKTKREVKVETRERTQAFEGVIISIRGAGPNAMFTVRHIGANAIGVERIFPLISPWINKIDVVKHGDVRRAKLYYLRGKTGREATRIDEVAPTAQAPQAK